jgi:hypothetical protein
MRLATIIQNLLDTKAPWASAALAAVSYDEKRAKQRAKMGLSAPTAKPVNGSVTEYSAVDQWNTSRGVL